MFKRQSAFNSVGITLREELLKEFPKRIVDVQSALDLAMTVKYETGTTKMVINKSAILLCVNQRRSDTTVTRTKMPQKEFSNVKLFEAFVRIMYR